MTDFNCEVPIYPEESKKQKPEDLILEKRLWRPFCLSYYLLIQTVLQLTHDVPIAKYPMLDQCAQYFSSSDHHLKALNQFARRYQPGQAVNWYTKDCFIHRIINKVLRYGNIESCSLLRFFIAGLSEQLDRLKMDQTAGRSDQQLTTILFRGLRQSEKHLQALKAFVGHRIITKGFMSTTRARSVALTFASVSHPQSIESQALILEIHVNLNAPGIVAVDISHLSSFPEEEEVLFDFGSQFQVESLTYDSLNSLWSCRLTAVSAECTSTDSYFTHCVKDEIIVPADVYKVEDAELDRIMRRERRRRLNDRRRDDDQLWSRVPSFSWIATDPSDRTIIAKQKALMNWQKNRNLEQFRSDCEAVWKTFEYQCRLGLPTEADIACYLNNLGYTFCELGDYQYAMQLLKQAVDIRQRIDTSAHFRAQSLRNLGLVYTRLGDYHRASVVLEKALGISESVSPTSQWTTAITLRNLAEFHHCRGDQKESMRSLHRALERMEFCSNAINENMSSWKKVPLIHENSIQKRI